MSTTNTVGIYLGEVADVKRALVEIRVIGFDYFCGNIVSSADRQSALQGRAVNDRGPFGCFDITVPPNDWRGSVVGILSNVHPQTESSKMNVRSSACNLIEKELDSAQQLGLHTTILNLPSGNAPNLSRLINSKLSKDNHNVTNLNLWVRMPLAWKAAGEGSHQSSWNLWNKFRCAVNAVPQIQPVLDLPVDLSNSEDIKRWLGEPVKAICLSDKHFIQNIKGHPVLPPRIKAIVKKFIDIGAQLIINCASDKQPNDYFDHYHYFQHLYNEYSSDWHNNPERKHNKGFEDLLRVPLQPLKNNLLANTYDIFERDPTKYNLYEEAITKALLAKVAEEEKHEKEVVCMVVGAGRGPLVRNCLIAAANTDRKVKIYALEKNENVVCTLLHLKKEIWGEKVTVISSDMREWDATDKADIMISELLGSFGDNELSPECLNGAQKFLKTDGIMIPKRYNSWICPVMSPKLHCELKTFQHPDKNQWAHFETPYGVCMKNFYQIDKPKALFQFEHPKFDNQSNDRYETLEFVAQNDCLMHGIAGYFDCELFNGVIMSILPETKSKGMFSWFPMFFPIRNPINLKKGEPIKVRFWRCCNKHNVWYEWSVSTSTVSGAIHNVNGRSYTIGL